MPENDWLADRFETHRSHLTAVAYRMLGSRGEADDAVQEAWFRLTRSDASDIENLAGWLTTVVARVSLDMLRSRASIRPGAAKLRDPQGRARLFTRGDHVDARDELVGGQGGAASRTDAPARAVQITSPAEPRRATSPALARYAALFNARDWDGVRAMLVDEVKLDLVSRWKATGRRQVSTYFTNYDSVTDWHLVPGWLDGREILAVLREPRAARPAYFIELRLVDDGRVAAIRDFRYVPYIAYEAEIELVS